MSSTVDWSGVRPCAAVHKCLGAMLAGCSRALAAEAEMAAVKAHAAQAMHRNQHLQLQVTPVYHPPRQHRYGQTAQKIPLDMANVPD